MTAFLSISKKEILLAQTPQRFVVAEDDELTCVLNNRIAPPFNLTQEHVAAHQIFDIPDLAPNDRPVPGSLGPKQLCKELFRADGMRGQDGGEGHPAKIRRFWLSWG